MAKRTSKKRHSRKRRSRANAGTSGVRVEKLRAGTYYLTLGLRTAEVFSDEPGEWYATMAGKRSRLHRTKAAAMKTAKAMLAGTTKNGWGRRASRGLKGKRRARSKRTSRRNTGYDYGMSHPGSYDSRGRPRRNSRKRRSRANQTYYIPIPPIKNRRRTSRRSRPNQTYYIPIPPIAKNRRRKRTSRR